MYVNIGISEINKIIKKIFSLVNLKFERYLIAGIQKLKIKIVVNLTRRYSLRTKVIIYFYS